MIRAAVAIGMIACASVPSGPATPAEPPRTPPTSAVSRCDLPPVPEMSPPIGYPRCTDMPRLYVLDGGSGGSGTVNVCSIYVTIDDMAAIGRAVDEMTVWLRAASACLNGSAR